MTQNPFEALGGGGLDLNALLQQAQQMQEQLATAQDQLAETIVEGTVAGGAVKAKVNGVGELVGLEIRQGEFDGNDPDELEDLAAVIVAAYRDAKTQADALAGQAFGPLTGGLGQGGGLPGGNPGQLGF
ncbi:YbaB/EbfC family nucleoid-associated protein [Nocardioides sp. BP30]|uniref:YbaB/EbfC family nucleoid-associated protein n=1 Tax=Nocardioides sp. BP30 TaxID=3036374 RepID=UPI002468F20D|nr:YbaB/EbfC family nucleoid-associated protein [Nocardioides sp. BP30]WGL52769.1 YbaB/EbfC family nucleoid-associated protein [Nocardioides sp. BP30]